MRRGAIQQRHLRSCPRDSDGRLKPHRCRGSWGYVIESGRRPDGSRRQLSKAGFASKREAQAALDELLARETAGLADTRKLTVAEYFADWLASKRSLRDTTRSDYTGTIKRYLGPGLGSIKLAELRPHHIDQMYNDILDGRLGKGTPATVLHIHRTLRSALNSAVKRRVIPWNPALHVELPQRRRPPTQVWTPADARRFLVASAGDRLAGLFHLMLFTGLRRGEALGLHWAHIDVENLVLVVQWQVTDAGDGPKLVAPKTRAGARNVPIDRGTAAVLQHRRAHQARERLAWGSGWEDHGLVFTHENGGLIRPDHASATFARLVRQAGVPRIRLHDLRHTHASLALAAGIQMKVVSDRLGHSTTAITADLYTHVIPAIARDAAERFAAAMVTPTSAVPSAFLAQKGPSRTGTDPPRDVSAGHEGSRQGDLNP